VAKKAEEIRRELAEKQPDAYTADWAKSLANLSASLGDVGRFGEALTAARKNEEIWRGLAEKQPDAYTADWAKSLANLGARLSDVGRFDEALASTKEAEEIRRGLAEKQPDAYTADWATSLGNLGVRLSEVGRFDEALAATTKAEEIRRGLAEKQPNAYTADWATSLGNLANAQLAEEEFNNALETANGAILRILPFADRYPPIYKPWLGFAKRIATESYLGMNKLEEALAEARCSVEIWTEVVTLRLNYESVQVAKAFRALMKCEIALGQNEAAITTLGRAFDMLCKPLNDNPKPLSPVMLELIDLASAVDHTAITRVVPAELLAIVRSSS
jgi:tetratricopeptide (TPR) repeat protein